MQLNNITKFINIKGLKVTNVIETEETIFLDGELYKKAKCCPHCKSKKNEIHDYRVQNIRDLPYRNKKVIIRFRRKRYKCRSCGKKFEVEPKFVSHKNQITIRLKQEIIFEIGQMITARAIAKKYYVSDFTVNSIMKLITPKRLELGEVLNIDEFKGNCDGIKYQTILTDSRTKRIIDILPSRFENDLKKYFSQIPEEERNRVKVFVSDMSKTFKMVHDKYFPKSVHIIDRYHYVRQVSWGFENVRKKEQKNMPESLRIYFKRSKSLLVKPYSKLNQVNEIDKVRIMIEKNENIKQAYIVKESFYNYVLGSKDKVESKIRIKAWLRYLETTGFEEFNECKKAFNNWQEQICNSFDYKDSNGFVEGHNNKTKALKRLGFGYRSFKTFRTRRLIMG